MKTATATKTASKKVVKITKLSAADQAELIRLRAENARLVAASKMAGRTSMKVSEKGGVSVYGLGRFPVTLYKEQWLKLLGMSEDIKTFIHDNDSALKTKDQKAS